MRANNDSQLNEFETEIIRWLVNAGSNPESVDAVPTGMRGSLTDVDWRLLFDVAQHHRLVPLMYEGARHLAEIVQLPPMFDERLENAFYANLAVSAVQLDHLHDLVQIAEHHGSPVYLLKGAAFADWLYDHPALRPMANLDIMVDEDDFELWNKELSGAGFEPSAPADDSCRLRHRLSGTSLELHRTLTSCSSYLGVKPQALVQRSRPALGFQSEMLRHLATEDHLLHLCLHGSFQHGFRQPAINAWDAVLLSEQPEFEWSRVLSQAKDPRLTPWIFAGISMCQRVFPTEGFDSAIERLLPLLAPKLRQLAVGLETRELLSLSNESTSAPTARGESRWEDMLHERGWKFFSKTKPADKLEQRFATIKRGLGAIWRQRVRLQPVWKQKHRPPSSGSASLSEISDV